MMNLEKVPEGLECPAKKADIHWEVNGSPEPAPEPDPGV